MRELDSADYQLLATALSELSLSCPGFDHALSTLANKISPDVEALRKQFQKLRADMSHPGQLTQEQYLSLIAEQESPSTVY